MLVYGSKQCPDTMECLSCLAGAGTPHEFRDISDLPVLKEFLRYRDTLPLFDAGRERGGVGIPFIVQDNGQFTFEWAEQG